GPLFAAYKHIYTMGVMTSKGFALPPETPQEIVDAYTGAAEKILKDDGFWKVAKKRLSAYPVLIGKDAHEAIKQAVDVSPEAMDYLKKFISSKFNVNI
ncbi:MAG: hypothetical protein RIB59_12515, partial [Rhodospirillales bacterium]